jgi:hypothetical protein
MRRTHILSAAATLVLALAASTASAQTTVVYPRGYYSPATTVGSQPVVNSATGAVVRPGTAYTTSPATGGYSYQPVMTGGRVAYNSAPSVGYNTTPVTTYRPVTAVVPPRFVTTPPTVVGGSGSMPTSYGTSPVTTYPTYYGTSPGTTYPSSAPVMYGAAPGGVITGGRNAIPTTPGTYTASNGTTIIIPGTPSTGTMVTGAMNTTPRAYTTNTTGTFPGTGYMPASNAPVSYSPRPFGSATTTITLPYIITMPRSSSGMLPASNAPVSYSTRPFGTTTTTVPSIVTPGYYSMPAPGYGTMAPSVVYPGMTSGTPGATTYNTAPGSVRYYGRSSTTTNSTTSPVVTGSVVPGGTTTTMPRTLESPRFLRPGGTAGGNYATAPRTIVPAPRNTTIVPR